MIQRFSKSDWQYLLPVVVVVAFFVGTNITGNLNKFELAYFSGGLLREPYRGITSHFVHGDFGHLLANIGGIIVARFFLKELQVKSNFLFAAIVFLLIPLQTSLQWIWDMYIFQNTDSFLIGFSGILYGVYSFILLSSIYGKQRFLALNIGLLTNTKVKEAVFVLTGIGFAWSLFPLISFSGHLTGFLSGAILFLL